MKKNRGIVSLVLTVVLIALMGFTVLVGFGKTGTGAMKNIKLGLDLKGGVSITYQVKDKNPTEEEMSDTIYKLQKRVEQYSKEASVYQEGSDRINIEIPGVSDANKILDARLAACGCQGKTVITGADVESASARAGEDQMGNREYSVELNLNENGKEKFAKATEENVGKQIAIIYDEAEISSPRVNEAITGGQAYITGNFTYEEADNLAATIRIGGLSLELEELHSKVVGAQLGVDAIETSLKAGAIGLVIVIVFMIAVYFIAGLASSLGLGMYVALIVLLLNGFDMTLTLSGIAGIILSIGMAVDANVIIFARIREELATGKTVKSSMKIGFDKALSAIVDGNITTLIAAAVLWLLGPGTVKGFAQTLALGIVLSMFTALVLTRLIMSSLYTLGLKDAKWYGIGKERRALQVLKHKKLFFGISAGLILAGFVVMGVHQVNSGDALNLSLEFKGGTATTVTFAESRTLEQINSEIVPYVEEITGSGVQIQTVQDSSEVIFKSDSLNMEQREALNQMFMERFGVEESEILSETISSTISDEMTRDTIIAVVVAIVCMLVYIRIRFSDIRFGASGVAALLHDVLVVLAFYAVARVSVSNTFIACMLTIVGYSINATIVIFDRVRENMAEMGRKESLEEVLDKSITQTLSRSIFTSLTTFIMVAVLYILGVTSIRDFALPLMVGILCGTYSSICLAGPLWYVLRKKFPPKATAGK